MRKPIIKAGDKYNRLTAVRFNHMDKYRNQHWLFKCDCGQEKIIRVISVKLGKTKSCGCLQRQKSSENLKKINTTHNMTYTKEYRAWCAMKSRVLNPNNINFKSYKKRNIKICEQWKNSFKQFYADMGKRPKGKKLCRINCNRNYEPKNCHWANEQNQQNNKRNNKYWLTYKGKKMTIAQWARKLGTNNNTLYSRISRGWSIRKALFAKIKII